MSFTWKLPFHKRGGSNGKKKDETRLYSVGGERISR